MTLKTRLTVTLAGIIVLAAATLGIVAVGTVRATVMNQVDARLEEVAARPSVGPPPPADGEDPPRGTPVPNQQDDDGYRRFADLLFDVDGMLIAVELSGFSDQPESMPDVDASMLDALLDGPVTVGAADGDGMFRALAKSLPTGRIQVIAESITDEQATVTRITQLALFGGLAVVVGAALLSWLAIRRGLRPVDRMVDTADAIARGDLSQRIDHHEGTTELGRLAGSLDDMMGQLEAAFAARAAGEARVRRFAADASHELRTPLTAIRGYAELYRRGGIPVGDPLDAAFQRIESESTRMTRLVEDLLLLARLDQQLPLDRDHVELDALIRQTAADLEAIDPERSVEVHIDRPVTILGDERRLRQVLANLGGNAITHTPAGSPIRLGLTQTTDHAVIEVSDEGPGIDPGIAGSVFDRFYRADKSRPDVTSTGGSGLGLSIVAGLVEAHGGRVELADGRVGATFRVFLPLDPARRAPTA